MMRTGPALPSLLSLLVALLVLASSSCPVVAIELIVPNGGLRWTAGETRQIVWDSTAGGSVYIEWTPNGGSLYWLPIEAVAPNTGTYSWLVPNIPTRNAYVRITELNTSESDSSDTFFVIAHIPTEQSEGHLYLSADPDAQIGNIDVEPVVEFDWFISADIDFSRTPDVSGLSAWEARVDIPPEMLITQKTLYPIGSFDFGGQATNLIVATGDCIEADRIPFTLVHFKSVLLSPRNDLLLELGPSEPSSTDPPEVPAWSGCSFNGGTWPFPQRSGLFVNRTSTAPTAERFALLQNEPNPFNPRTVIRFRLPSATAYRLEILDVRGRLVRSFAARGVRGPSTIVWDGTDRSGRDVASGTYFYRLESAEFSQTRRMVLAR